MSYLSRVKGLEKIPVCEGPLTPNSKILYLSPAEFKDKFNCEYSEDLCSSLSTSPQLDYNPNTSNVTPKQVRERKVTPLDGLVICKLADPVGYSIMTAKPIKDKTLIGFYHGHLESENTKNDTTFAINFGISSLINPLKFGGILRFMAHLPMNKSRVVSKFKDSLINFYKKEYGPHSIPKINKMLLEKNGIDLDTYVREQFMPMNDDMNYIDYQKNFDTKDVAYANVHMEELIVDNHVYNAVFAMADIPAYSVIGYTYGHFYFLNRRNIKPKLLFTNGQLLPESSYTYNVSPASKEYLKELFQSAIKDCFSQQYQTALHKLSILACSFTGKDGKATPELAIVHSTMASCYRGLKQYDKAVDFSLSACTISSKFKLETAKHEREKLISCLFLYNTTKEARNELYKKAVFLYHDKCYEFSLLILARIKESYVNEKPAYITCLSTMVSCHRELGEYDEANELCNTAIKLAKEHLGEQHETTKKLLTKRKSIEDSFRTAFKPR